VKSKLLSTSEGRRTFAVIFDKEDEAKSGLTAFANDNRIQGAQFTAVGAFKSAVLGYFDRNQKDYRRISVHEQVEVLSFLGDLALTPDGKPEVHAHVVVGRSDGSTQGGHLLEGTVWPTLEVILVDVPEHLRKTPDPETGLALINPRL